MCEFHMLLCYGLILLLIITPLISRSEIMTTYLEDTEVRPIIVAT